MILGNTETLRNPTRDPKELKPELPDDVKMAIDESGFDANYLMDTDGEIDLETDSDDRKFQVTTTTLESNKLFVESARELMPLFFKKPEIEIPELGGVAPDMPDASDMEAAQWGIELMGKFNWNMMEMGSMAGRMQDAPLRQRVAFYNLMQAYDKLPNFTSDGSIRMLKGLGSDLSTYVGLGTFGAGFATRYATKKAGKEGLKNYLRSVMPSALAAGIEGGAYASIDDAVRQYQKIGAEKQDEFNTGQNVISGGIGIGAGTIMGTTLPAAPELIMKGVRKFGQYLNQMVSQPNVVRSGVGPVDDNVTKRVDVQDREIRTTKAARLNSDDRAAIDQISKNNNFKPSEVEAEHRRIKEQYPESEGWAKIELNTEKNIKKKKGKGFDLAYKEQPYGFNRPKKGKAPPIPDAKMVAKSSDGMVAEVVALFERAKSGDKAAAQIIEHKNWYKNMRERLRAEFGSMADVFADVIGATSAQTNVRQNWENSIEVMSRFSKGDYDEPLNRLKAWLDNDGTIGSGKDTGDGYVDMHMRVRNEAKAAGASDTEAFDAAQLEFPLITKSNGKLINANSPATMLALLDLFRVKLPKGSPKTYNFTGNLIGYSNLATIDVWAARYLRRIGGGKRIPPPAEQGVGGEFGTVDVDQVTGEFGFGQAVFSEAANKLREKGIDLGDDDLQAVVWFMEKELWTRKGYTTRSGEGGSLEFEADVAGIPDREALKQARKDIETDPTFKKRADTQAMIDNPEEIALAETRAARTEELQGFMDARTPAQKRDWVKSNFNIEDNDVAREMVAELRKETTVLKRENKKREALQPRLDRLTEAKETATAEGEKFIAEEAAPVRRFTAGASLDRPQKTATNEMMSNAQKRLSGVIEGDDSVVMGKATSSIGRYIDPKGEVFDERALDFEYVARQDHNPDEVVRQLVQEAKDTNQESVFFSEVVKPNTIANANPGMEVYFNRKLTADKVKKLTLKIDELKTDTGFTFATDFRQSDKTAAGRESETYVGLRMQYIPQFGGGEEGAKIATKSLLEARKKLIDELDFIANVEYMEYDTQVFFRDNGDYDGVLTGNL